jgi:hypothetical protein
LATPALSGHASLDVRAGPNSCLVSPPDLTDLTAAAGPTDNGATSVRVDGTFDARFATCPVVVLVDGRAVQDFTTIRADGTILAITEIPQEPPRAGGTVEVTAIDGRAIKQVGFTIPTPPPTGPNWLLWLLLALAILVSATVARSARDRRQRRWIAQHVQVAPTPSQPAVSADREPGSGPSLGIRLVPRSDPATIHITTEEDR